MNMVDELQPIFRRVFERDDLVITENTTAFDIDGWDSFAQLKLSAAVEEHFKVKFALGELENFDTVRDIIEIVEEKLK